MAKASISVDEKSDIEEPVPYGSTRKSVGDPHITLGHGIGYTYGKASGIPDLTRAELAKEVLKLHPDFWNQRYITGMNGSPFFRNVPEAPRDGLDLSAALELPASLGFSWMPRDVPLDKRPAEDGLSGYLSQLPKQDQWHGPNGKPATEPLHVSTARGLYGEVKTLFESPDGTAGYPVSVYAPGPTSYHSTNNAQAVFYGANATEMDTAIGPSNLLEGDFSIWARRAFREYIRNLPQDRQNRLEIDDLETFDIQSYVQDLQNSIRSGGADESAAITDPVVFEFYLMEQKRLLEYYRSYRDTGDQAAEQVQSPLTTLGNQGSYIASERSNGSILLSKVFDLVEMEGPITLPGDESSEEEYHPAIRTTSHKRAAAVSQALDKPVVEHGFYGTGGRTGALDPTKRYPNLQTLNFAEVYANGSTRQLDLDGWNGKPPDQVALMWLDPNTGEVPTRLRELADFLWTYKRDLEGTPTSDVGIVYSIPTMLAKARPFIDRRGNRMRKMLDGMVRAARENQIPTNLVIFGHPELWDDSTVLKQLESYQTLVLPGVTALTQSQFDAIVRFIDNGGTVLAEGNVGTRDEYYRIREEGLSRYDGVIDINRAGRDAAEGEVGSAENTLAETVNSPTVEVAGPDSLACEILRSDDNWYNIHLVNYNYDAGTDKINRVEDIELRFHDPNGDVQGVDLISPSADPIDLSWEREQEYVTTTVPAVSVWGVVRFKTSSRQPNASKAEVSSATDSARTQLESVSNTPRKIQKWKAEAALYEAELAQAAGQYDRAIERVERAETEAIEADNHLVIGIDSGHGQAPGRTFDGLSEFRAKYSEKYEITFKELSSIRPETLEGLHGILIGSALDFKGQSYEYSIEDLKLLERFVHEGGRIGVVVRAGVADGINELTERFGISIDKQMITPPGNDGPVKFHPVTYRTPITYQLTPNSLWAPTCSLRDLEDGVSIHVTTASNMTKRGEGQRGKFPITATRRYGEGAIVVHTNDGMFQELQSSSETQARNILRFIARGDANLGKAETPMTSTKSTTGGTPDQEQTTSSESPGFGIPAGIVSLLGGTYLMKRVKSDDNQD